MEFISAIKQMASRCVRGLNSCISSPPDRPFPGAVEGWRCERGGPPFSSPKLISREDAQRGPSRARQEHKAQGLTQLQGSQLGGLCAHPLRQLQAWISNLHALNERVSPGCKIAERRSSWFTGPLRWSPYILLKC